MIFAKTMDTAKTNFKHMCNVHMFVNQCSINVKIEEP